MADPLTTSGVHLVQISWGAISLLIVILGFFIKSWINAVTKKLECKQDKSVCNERFPITQDNVSKLFTHRHPIRSEAEETGGVVIP